VALSDNSAPRVFDVSADQMANEIFLNYDQAALDAEYDNRGKVEDFQNFLDDYVTLSAHARQTLACRLDVVYGDQPGELLDIFQPTARQNPGPILIYIHGGYWKSLSKKEHSFVALGLAPMGVTTLVIDYDLMPGVRMDELVRQCRNAVIWAYRNADRLAADPEQIYVCGHSAGGHLTAMIAATDWPDAANLRSDTVKGCTGLSGLYDLEPIRLCFLNDDLAMSQAEAARNSPMSLMPNVTPPLQAIVGSEEGTEYLRQSNGLAAAWSKGGHDTKAVTIAGHNHFSIVHRLSEPESDVTKIVLAQMGL
jgi:arylformamidase